MRRNSRRSQPDGTGSKEPSRYVKKRQTPRPVDDLEWVGQVRSSSDMHAVPREHVETRTARITQSRGVFSMACRVKLNIRSAAAVIWNLLTDAEGFPRWNSTITRIEGEIREGGRLRLHVPGTARTFTPRVSGVVPDERMTWTGGFSPLFKGVRTFELTPRADGSTDFVMEERFSGLVLPFVRGSMPDFGPVFERYANDLKREAELRR